MTSAAKERSQPADRRVGRGVLSTGDAAPIFVQRTTSVDEVVRNTFSSTLEPVFPAGLALLAVGGYGRRELFPYSDVDLLLLTASPIATSTEKGAISEFVRRLWDAGFRCSQSVRTPEECCALIEGNLELTISLLDERFLCGDAALYAQFGQRLAAFVNLERKTILRRLCKATRERHAKYHATIYRLEPDVKEAPGGLRDIHATRWLSRLRAHRRAEWTNRRSASCPRCARFSTSVRRAIRTCSTSSGRTHSPRRPSRRGSDPAEWMRAWYRNASAIWLDVQSELEAAEAGERSMLSNFRDWRSRLSNSEFTVSRDLIFLRNPHELSTDEALPLRLFEFIARHKVSPARQSERRVSAYVAKYASAYAARPVRARWWRTFFSLTSPALALRSMRACGFLTAILPEWERIEHLVVRDFYHHYTVDEHTFVTLESIEDLSHVKEGPTQRFATILDESRGDVWMLLLALLMHDIGKGYGGGHERKSVELATVVLQRAGFSEEERATILFLVAHHLDLSSLLTTHDLSDPATARHAAAIVETVERLRLLTLMTLADINAVNPSALTPWRLEQLWRLYRVTQREINRELGEEPAAPLAALTDDPVLAEFLQGLPKRYFSPTR